MRLLFCLFLFLFGVFVTVPVMADSYGVMVPTVETVSDDHHPQEGEPEKIARYNFSKVLYLPRDETQLPFASLLLTRLSVNLWRPPKNVAA
ncbi:MAG: hypothetical protein DI626_00135 [Micavibrio aeruginosavorus]|uniref:Uncharacterized protein n=1 Tax=Micavibrio aeruginosavorus TaxID=349221 RepID=A0A2W5A798_9BACT|nr:MAG: hypothetical protein DI626_00135 [Micavibrio aeruginosavorus]